jgi:hypothetical protein
MFLSLEMDSARISLFSGSIVTHNPQPNVLGSNFYQGFINYMYSSIIFPLEYIFLESCLCIQFQIATWLLFIFCKKNIILETLLVDRPRKYKYNTRPRCSVSFTKHIRNRGHLQAIGLSLS